MEDEFDRNELDEHDQIQIDELAKKEDKEKEIFDDDNDNYLLAKERASDTSKNTDYFNHQNSRFTTIDNNFENSQQEEEESIRKSNLSKDNSKPEIVENRNSNEKIKNRKTKSGKDIIEMKIILLGDVAVGKTSIFGRYTKNSFNECYKCTVQVEKQTKFIDIDLQTSVKLVIWDTCGQERYRNITRQYYRDCDGAVIVFDLTNTDSFENVPKWIEELKNNGPPNISILIVGNKSDLTNERVVPINDINKLIGNKYLYYDVSAKNGNNVDLAFGKIKTQIFNRIKNIKNKRDDSDIRYNMNPRDSKELDNFGEAVTGKSHKCC
jgi:small GTP-binding protein